MCLKLCFHPMLLLLLHFWGTKELYHELDVGYCSLRGVLGIHGKNVCIFFFPSPFISEKKYSWILNCTCCMCKLDRSSIYCMCTTGFFGRLEIIKECCESPKEKVNVNTGSSRREIITNKWGRSLGSGGFIWVFTPPFHLRCLSVLIKAQSQLSHTPVLFTCSS